MPVLTPFSREDTDAQSDERFVSQPDSSRLNPGRLTLEHSSLCVLSWVPLFACRKTSYFRGGRGGSQGGGIVVVLEERA